MIKRIGRIINKERNITIYIDLYSFLLLKKFNIYYILSSLEILRRFC